MSDGLSNRGKTVAVIVGLVVVILAFIWWNEAHAQVIQATDSTAVANSNANANSGSVSGANANSNQTQGQTVTSNLGASQGNAQNITFNTQQRERTKVDTNTAVPLAAAVSFSSDYCGGVGSAGASAAGISIGASKPVMDGNCQSMRRAEKFGVMAVTAKNMGEHTQASRLLAMAIWELCTAEGNSQYAYASKRGEAGVPSTQAGCLHLGLVKPEETATHPAMPTEQVQQLQHTKASMEAAQGAVDLVTRQPQTAPPYNPAGAAARLPGT